MSLEQNLDQNKRHSCPLLQADNTCYLYDKVCPYIKPDLCEDYVLAYFTMRDRPLTQEKRE